jgi:hypothetical protein
MYKTISIQQNTYQNLQAIATRLEKPKAQVIDDLVKGYIESMKEQEKQELQNFNAFAQTLAKQVKLPQGTNVNTTTLDQEFNALKEINY